MNNQFHTKITSNLIWLIVLNIGYLLIFPFDNLALTYLFRIPSLIIIVFIILRCYPYTYPQYRFSLMMIAFICAMNLIRNGISFNLVLSIFSAFSLLFLIIISSTIPLSQKFKKTIFKLSVIALLVLTVHAFSPYGHLTKNYDGMLFNSIYLTFGYGNSNFAGIIAFLVYSCMWMSASYKGIYNRLIVIILSVWGLYMIYQTNCRSALAAALLVPIATIIFAKKRIPNWVIYLFCAIPFVFVPYYINFAAESYSDTKFMGKSVMSGRQYIYEDCFKNLIGPLDYLIGTFEYNPFNNNHNGPLSVFTSLGLIGTFFYFRIIIDRLKRYNDGSTTLNAKAAIFAVLAIFIESCGEGTLFLGGFPAITLIFIIYIFAGTKES